MLVTRNHPLLAPPVHVAGAGKPMAALTLKVTVFPTENCCAPANEQVAEGVCDTPKQDIKQRKTDIINLMWSRLNFITNNFIDLIAEKYC